MKSNTIYILVLVLFASLTSCSDLLKEEPKDRINAENYFVNMDSYEAVINASYGQLIANTWDRSLGSARVRSLFAGADDWTSQPGGNKYDWKQGDQLAISSADYQISNNGWSLPYDVILQANFAIDNIQTMVDLGIGETTVKTKAAEAYFLRAWGYFWLVRLYGGVPLILTPQDSEEKRNIGRSTEVQVYTQILSDLEFAILYLPEMQSEYGRVNKWAAKTLRSSVYLTMASWPLKQTDKYALALADAEDIIKNSPYRLESNFSDIFDFENELTNSEFIWQLVFCTIEDCIRPVLSPFSSQTTKPMEIGGFQDLFIEKAFFRKFPEGARKEVTFLDKLVESIDTVAIADTTLVNDSTILLREIINETTASIQYVIPWQKFAWKHPFLSKFYSGSVDKYAPIETIKGGSTSNAGIDFPMYRLTEVYLIYAEAQIKGGGGDAATALEYVNMIRRRAKGVDMNTPDVDDLTSLNLDVIIDERAWEFVGEMKRWFDLIRTEKLAEALSDRDPSELPLIGDPKNKNLYYHPIPDKDIDINPNLVQNQR